MTGFDKMFWGLLFFFNFRIQGFDLLPNFVGYLFFYAGLQDLINKESYFATAKKFTIPLAVLSFFQFYQPQNHPGILFQSFNGFGILISIAVTILDLLMMYYVTTGIAELAHNHGQYGLAQTAKKRWQLYAFTLFAGIFTMLFTLIVPPLAIVLIIGLFILTIVVLILMMLLMKESNHLIIDHIGE